MPNLTTLFSMYETFCVVFCVHLAMTFFIYALNGPIGFKHKNKRKRSYISMYALNIGQIVISLIAAFLYLTWFFWFFKLMTFTPYFAHILSTLLTLLVRERFDYLYQSVTSNF